MPGWFNWRVGNATVRRNRASTPGGLWTGERFTD
jgi:hypothetical protein